MLADKQAALEKLRWEAMTSNTLAEKLQEDVNTMQAEMSSIMILCEGLRKNNDDVSTEDYDVPLNHIDHIPDDVVRGRPFLTGLCFVCGYFFKYIFCIHKFLISNIMEILFSRN